MRYVNLPLSENVYRKKVDGLDTLFENTKHSKTKVATRYLGEFLDENDPRRRQFVYWDNTILQLERLDLVRSEVDFRLNTIHKDFDFVSDRIQETPEIFYIRPRAIYKSYNFEPIGMDLILKENHKL